MNQEKEMQIFNFSKPEDYKACKRLAEMRVVKRPVWHDAYILKEDTILVTPSGKQYGKAGDYVIIGKDHAWPVSPEYFAEHYDIHETP
jgi:hypothetical protein